MTIAHALLEARFTKRVADRIKEPYLLQSIFDEDFSIIAASLHNLDESLTLKSFTVDNIHGDTVHFTAYYELMRPLPFAHENTTGQLFRVECKARIGIEVEEIEVNKPTRCAKIEEGSARYTESLLPKLYRRDYDDEATTFLQEYCPEALQTPICVPIHEIATKRLGLQIIIGKRITPEFNIFGMICFTPCELTVYDTATFEPQQITAQRGTLLVDSAAYATRNIGNARNTIAHETYHWYRHRVHASLRGIQEAGRAVAYRCPVVERTQKRKTRTDAEWMELHANAIAPRILMPRDAVHIKVQEYLQAYKDAPSIPWDDIVAQIASFFEVSEQSARLRLKDLGYDPSDRGQDQLQTAYRITLMEAFDLYCRVNAFRRCLDDGIFVYVDGYVVKNDRQNLMITKDGVITISSAARENLDACALSFTYRLVQNPKLNRILFRSKSLTVTANHLYAEYERKYAIDEVRDLGFKATARLFFLAHHCTSPEVFMEYTGMSESTYKRILKESEEDWCPDFKTVATICFGLRLRPHEAEQLFDSAGYARCNSQQYLAATFVLTLAADPVKSPIKRCKEIFAELSPPPNAKKRGSAADPSE